MGQTLNGSPSPQSFTYYWYFQAFATLGGGLPGYEFLGWEEVAGHRCLKVKLGIAPGVDTVDIHDIFWIDVARGGHPLKVESYYKGNLLYRVAPIELSRVNAADGHPVWFPVKGEVNVFGTIGGEFDQYPTARETYGVVMGSLQLNIDLPDSVFVVHTKPRRQIGNSTALRSEHPVEARQPKVERLKTDPASVEARLNAQMAEADRQAKEIEASSPARASWGATGAAQAVLALLGVVLIGSGGVWMWRRS